MKDRVRRAEGSALLLLVDLSFAQLRIPQLVRATYVASLAIAALVATYYVLAGAPVESANALLFRAGLAGVVLLFVMLVVRTGLEALLALFRLAESAAEIAEHEATVALNTTQYPDTGAHRSPSTRASASPGAVESS